MTKPPGSLLILGWVSRRMAAVLCVVLGTKLRGRHERGVGICLEDNEQEKVRLHHTRQPWRNGEGAVSGPGWWTTPHGCRADSGYVPCAQGCFCKKPVSSSLQELLWEFPPTPRRLSRMLNSASQGGSDHHSLQADHDVHTVNLAIFTGNNPPLEKGPCTLYHQPEELPLWATRLPWSLHKASLMRCWDYRAFIFGAQGIFTPIIAFYFHKTPIRWGERWVG